jgi:hypothetical protein
LSKVPAGKDFNHRRDIVGLDQVAAVWKGLGHDGSVGWFA